MLGRLKVFQLAQKVSFTTKTKSSFAMEMEKAVKEQINQKLEETSDKKNKKERYNGKVKRRAWQDYTDDSAKKFKELDPSERIKRKKSIILLGYSGVNYFGMQRNPDTSTIEEELLKALLKNKWINEEGFNAPQQIQFQRAARTDKGVSAAQQIVSLKLPETLDLEAINKDLPEAIKIFCVKRVTKGFNSKLSCDARTYSYTMPSIAFADKSEGIVDESTYRMPDGRLEIFNNILKIYLGTKNFHNFTCRKDFADPSAKRFIMNFECEEPFVPENCNVEFARIRIKGQSFMMHQIRKMVGLAIAIMRGLTIPDTITRALTKDRLDIPMAPGLGLVLDEIHYTRYAERYGADGLHDPLTFDDEKEEIEKFFLKHILTTIIDTEVKEKSMLSWVETLGMHSYDIREDKAPNTDSKEDDGNKSD